MGWVGMPGPHSSSPSSLGAAALGKVPRGDAVGQPRGLTEACRCVLERIPWIFTWLLLAAAMSTHSPLSRASPGP